MNNNLAIGKDNKLLWHIPEDLKFFKKMTLNQPILMGRKTKESLPIFPLPNRLNLVLTRTPKHDYEVSSLEQAVELCKDYDTLWIIGGQSLYDTYLEQVDEVYLTSVLNDEEGDTFFPYTRMIELFKNKDVLEVHDNCTMLKFFK